MAKIIAIVGIVYLIVCATRLAIFTTQIANRLAEYERMYLTNVSLEDKELIFKEWNEYQQHCLDDLAKRTFLFKGSLW